MTNRKLSSHLRFPAPRRAVRDEPFWPVIADEESGAEGGCSELDRAQALPALVEHLRERGLEALH